jgi:hypothetical protein
MFRVVGVTPDGNYHWTEDKVTVLCYDCELSWTRYARKQANHPTSTTWWTEWTALRKRELQKNDKRREARARRRRDAGL